MNENGERISSSDCENNILQTSSPETKMLEGLSIDSEVPNNLEKLPSDSLQHILSFMTYEKMSEMRKVSKVFNATAKKLLDKAQKELKSRLKAEIEMAEKKVLFSTNDRLRFLIDLRNAITNCEMTNRFCAGYFEAGTWLDEANSLLKDFNSLTVVPYFQDHACDRKTHPILGPMVAHAIRADKHFLHIILRNAYETLLTVEVEENDMLHLRNDFQGTKMRQIKTTWLKNRRRIIYCGNELRGELLKSISKVNENVLHLTQLAIKVDNEVERVLNRMDESIVPNNKNENNCFFQLSEFSNSLNRSTKMMENTSLKRHKLATLPLSSIQNIFSYLKCDKMAQLRMLCRSFNEASKNQLRQEFEKLTLKLEFLIKCLGTECMFYFPVCKPDAVGANVARDIYGLLQLCNANYKWHLGSNLYFVAGKVLDEANRMYDDFCPSDDFSARFEGVLDLTYEFRPHFYLFRLVDSVYKAIAHFRFTIVPEYYPSAQNRIYVPDFINSSDIMKFEKCCQLNLEEIEKLIEATDEKIKEQNDRNRKYLNIISTLKKKVFILNKKISEEINVLKEID